MNTEVEEQTEFKFSELSESAKQTAREHYTSGEYPGYEWWEDVYDDAVRMGSLMGIAISSTTRRTTSGRCYQDIDISFSGFCSQGDGASFEGDYSFVPDAVQKIKSECNDEELIRIAQELTLLQVTRRIKGLEPFSATIKADGRYSHSGTMNVTVTADDDGMNDDPVTEIEEPITQLMRDFADWIYKNLETEYDYLCSDEYVNEHLEDGDDLFDEDGLQI